MNKHDKIKQEVDEFNERLEKAYDTFYGDVYINQFIHNIIIESKQTSNIQKSRKYTI